MRTVLIKLTAHWYINCMWSILLFQTDRMAPCCARFLQSDGHPPNAFECCETSTPDKDQLPLHEVVLEDENLSQQHTSSSHCKGKKIIAALEA